MPDLLHAALFPDTLSDAERGEVRRVLAEDAEAYRLYRRVEALQARVAEALEATSPDPQVQVLDALARCGHARGLHAGEHARLQAAAEALEAFRATDTGQVLHRALDRDVALFDACWEAAASPVPSRRDRAPQRRAQAPRRLWRVGAGLAVVLFAAVVVLLVQRDASYTTLEVASGTTQRVLLADGSSVRLVGPARLTYSDPDAGAVFNRQVTLVGDAFFEVEPGVQAFIVRTAHADVRVLGTSFGVRSQEEVTEVTLVDGRLLLAPPGDAARGVTLRPGQQSRIVRNGAVPTPPEAVAPAEALRWTGLFFFSDTPMRDAVAQLQERFGVQIGLGAALAGERVTGTFDQAQGVEEILRTLTTALGASLSQTETGWYLAK